VLDYSTTFLGFIFLSMPTFWFAILLKQGGVWFNEHTHTQTFSTIGERSIPITDHSFWGSLKDIAGHMVLPVIVLGLVGYAAWSRFTRASMLEVLNSDYVRLARSKGLSPRTVLVKHALRTALIPLATVTALDIAALLGGAIVTETVFQWHGMGYLFLTAVTGIDFNIMLGWLLVAAFIVIMFNLIADLLYGVLDPRIRHA
jgi:peptide/nickel transport system permease protein